MGNYRKIILLTKITAEQNEVALGHPRMHRLYFLVVIFVRNIVQILLRNEKNQRI